MAVFIDLDHLVTASNGLVLEFRKSNLTWKDCYILGMSFSAKYE
jgi:hypothetical protein